VQQAGKKGRGRLFVFTFIVTQTVVLTAAGNNALMNGKGVLPSYETLLNESLPS
jgi:hypothetical protein